MCKNHGEDYTWIMGIIRGDSQKLARDFHYHNPGVRKSFGNVGDTNRSAMNHPLYFCPKMGEIKVRLVIGLLICKEYLKRLLQIRNFSNLYLLIFSNSTKSFALVMLLDFFI